MMIRQTNMVPYKVSEASLADSGKYVCYAVNRKGPSEAEALVKGMCISLTYKLICTYHQMS